MILFRRMMARTDRFRPWIISGIIVFIVAEILLFSPSSVDSWGSASGPSEIDPEELAASFESDLKAMGADSTKIPEYSVNEFDDTSTEKGHRQWKLKASRGYLYHQDRLVLARTAEAQLYDSEGKITLITGNYARYEMGHKSLEIFGKVTTRFPDGFLVHSEYVHYDPSTKKVDIPSRYAAEGEGLVEPTRRLRFTSMGLHFQMGESLISLPQDVQFLIEPNKKNSQNQSETTTIESDECDIDRTKRIALFAMKPERPSEEAFVHLRQPTLLIKSRKMSLRYGDENGKTSFDTILAEQDVFLQEKGKKTVNRYGTAGKGLFDTKKNVVYLTEFPQLYQDEDTVTGEVIVLHRDTDIVEVEKSNAFSRGEEKP